MKNRTSLCIVIAILLFTSCSDFLELTPETNVGTTGNFYKSTIDIEYALTAAYACLQDAKLYREDMVIMADVRSDDLSNFANVGGNSGREYNIKIFTASSDNLIFRDVWKKTYELIYRCNNVIKHIGVVTDAKLKVQYESEARFLRALSYFNIVRFWGAAPLILTPLTPAEVATSVRNSTGEIYSAIETDLLFASNPNNLPKSFSGNNLGRATSLTAKALLGKVYLQQKKWQAAKTTLGELINADNNGTYGLLPDIADVFSTAPAAGSTEADFAAYTQWKPQTMNKEMMFAALFNKDISGEGRNALVYYANQVADINEIFKVSSDKCIYDVTDRRADLIRVMKGTSSSTNLLVKYADTESTLRQWGYHTPILRWSDVLLMYAEAANEDTFDNSAGSPALLALNAVRTRSFSAGAYSSADLSTQEAFRKAVWLERRLEFPMEMQRLFDLQRYESVVPNEAIAAFSAIGLTIDRNDLLYPVPNNEIVLRNDPLNFPQNPGYDGY
jgi:hypothetical protein